MIEIRIPKEINDYKEKFLFGLTVRQFVSVAAALGAAIPLYIFSKDHISADMAGWLVLLVVVPIFGFGFFKYNGMTFERLVVVIFRQMFIEPQVRKYEDLSIFWDLSQEAIEIDIARQKAEKRRAARLAKAERKNIRKQKKG